MLLFIYFKIINVFKNLTQLELNLVVRLFEIYKFFLNFINKDKAFIYNLG